MCKSRRGNLKFCRKSCTMNHSYLRGITPQGYLHSMFIHADFQGKGIATMLLEEIERYAIKEGIMRITSEVSITARPFFEKQGYIVEVEQKRRANQLCLTNYWMAKNLTK